MSTKEKLVYIIDDETIITGPMERLLSRALRKSKKGEYKIQTGNHPVDVLAEMQNFSKNGSDVALIIADYMMPEMRGNEFLQEAKKIYPLAPQIILTGFADKENAIDALNNLELFYYAEKPWNNQVFTKLVLQALEKHRQYKIEAMFQRYVPYEIIEDYVDRSDESFLIGNNIEATVLFLDIVNFTKKSERMEPEDVVILLNNYFTEMLDIIDEKGGILDKFTGDGLMALFGVPTSSNSIAQDALYAVEAAQEIADRVETLNESAEDLGYPPLRVRMGLNTGNVVVGNIGSKKRHKRVNYTAVSDVVNTAARIEEAARNYIGDDISCILISEATRNLLPDSDARVYEALDPIELRGKSDVYTLYKVVATGL